MMYGIHSAAVSMAVHARYQRSVVMRFAPCRRRVGSTSRERRQQIDGRGWAISTFGGQVGVLASISSAQRLIFARVRHPYGRRPLGNGAGKRMSAEDLSSAPG